MADEDRPQIPDGAERPLPPGPLLRIGHGGLQLEVAPEAGGRIAQIRVDGEPWLVGPDDGHPGAIAWGCYPMLPWAGRIRDGAFAFRGRRHRLPANLGPHAIHGVGFVLRWRIEAHADDRVELALALPRDARWPFGGQARQAIEARRDGLHLRLSLQADDRDMPQPVLGWHPWFRKPDRLDFRPERVYPRDAQGIAALPTQAPPAGPWDDCFVSHEPVVLERGGRRLRLASGCDHWVVYDQPAHATCVEPQSGPPDVFNLAPATLASGQALEVWFHLDWTASGD